MKSFKEYISEGAVKDLLPKKWKHALNRALHGKKYKIALDLYHNMVRDINRNPDNYKGAVGTIIANPKGLARSKAASMLGIKPREFTKILDRKTRYEDINEEITKVDLAQVEKFADKIFAKVGIDVEFTRHFLDRVNDPRNGKEISVAELTRLFKQTYKKYGKKIAKMGDDAEAVLNDMQTDINVPFVLKWDGKEFDLISKTIMRKKDFKTNDPKLKV
jgi:hypothetical protein